MKELFEELVYKHLREYHPRTKFETLSDKVTGIEYTWINKKSNWQTYIYLTKHRIQHCWCVVITTDKLKGKDILMKELSILGFMVTDL